MKAQGIKRIVLLLGILLLSGGCCLTVKAEGLNGWQEEDGKLYWYEAGVRQGYDPENPDYRGKEIYDRNEKAWFWLDNAEGGARAVSKDVYQESDAGPWAENQETGTGKWVRYDENGHMVKGWDTNEKGVYFFDKTFGTMAKGWVDVGFRRFYFNEVTGVMEQFDTQIMYQWFTPYQLQSQYWLENGVLQGYDPENPDYRGKEIYDTNEKAWFWLDATNGGAKTVSKDVYQESAAGPWAENQETGTGKWVRYDENGHMVKGWDTNENGSYYFDEQYGTMAKGKVTIGDKEYVFDEVTGVLITKEQTEWLHLGEQDFWYENGVRQGYDPENPDYRGKEIYDPDSDAWYWLDNVQYGAKAVNKDVYQESDAGQWAENKETGTGKWVRYDKDGHMVKGWDTNEKGTYYFDPAYGTMARGGVFIEGKPYIFDSVTGVLYEEVVDKNTGDMTIKVKAEDVKYSGKEGGISWTITKDGKLIIAGICGEEQADGWTKEWVNYYKEIKSVCIDIKNATNMSWLFSGLEKMRYIDGLEVLDTSKVKSMRGMFSDCKNLNTLDVSNFDTGNVTDMRYMFSAGFSYYTGHPTNKSIDLSSFDTSNVTNMEGMFAGSYVRELDLSSFDTSNVTNMSYMFEDCSQNIIDIDGFDTGKVTTMRGMFRGAYVKELDLTNFDTSNVTDMSEMFAIGSDWRKSYLSKIDLSSFDTGKVINMRSMFEDCDELTDLDLSSFDTGNVKDMSNMFAGTKALTRITVGKAWVIQPDTEVNEMFQDCGTDCVTKK